MIKKSNTPKWIETLRALMDVRGYNPRSLSLKAGLNATAVRDMLEGRAKFPRYDTVEALSNALNITPNDLMKEKADKILDEEKAPIYPQTRLRDEELTLLTDIITQLKETVTEYRQELKPSEFAAMVTTIFSHISAQEAPHKIENIANNIKYLITYEHLRKSKCNE